MPVSDGTHEVIQEIYSTLFSNIFHCQAAEEPCLMDKSAEVVTAFFHAVQERCRLRGVPFPEEITTPEALEQYYLEPSVRYKVLAWLHYAQEQAERLAKVKIEYDALGFAAFPPIIQEALFSFAQFLCACNGCSLPQNVRTYAELEEYVNSTQPEMDAYILACSLNPLPDDFDEEFTAVERELDQDIEAAGGFEQWNAQKTAEELDTEDLLLARLEAQGHITVKESDLNFTPERLAHGRELLREDRVHRILRRKKRTKTS